MSAQEDRDYGWPGSRYTTPSGETKTVQEDEVISNHKLYRERPWGKEYVMDVNIPRTAAEKQAAMQKVGLGAAQAGEQISSDGYFIRTKADGTTEKISRVSHVGKEYNEWDNGGGSSFIHKIRDY